MPKSDEQLMLNYAKGQVDDFNELYERYKGPLYRFVLHQIGTKELCDELYQDTWAKVIRSRNTYRAEAKFKTWLFQIAKNTIIDHYRVDKSKNHDEYTESKSTDHQLTGSSHHGHGDLKKRLKEAIAQLPHDQRNAFLLKEEGGFSLQEIAEISNTSRETIKSRLRYATSKLKSLLKEIWP